MATPSIWQAGLEQLTFPVLSEDLRVDAVVIGGGITGITAAQLLARNGQSAAVLEAKTVGSGTTGHSTGNLYTPLDEYLHRLIERWSRETIDAVMRSRAAAIDLIEHNVRRYGIDCDFIRVPWVLYATGGSRERRQLIRQEFEAAGALGLSARLLESMQFVVPVDEALMIDRQAQFHPLRYVRQLAAAIASEHCAIHENTPVVTIDAESGQVRTPDHTVYARHIVMASHTPKGFNILQTQLGPYREYAVAGPLGTAAWARGIYWAIGEVAHSTRSVRLADGDRQPEEYLLCIGEKHKVGQQADTEAPYAKLQAYARQHYGLERFDFQWSAQHYRPADGLPYIGRALGSPRVFVATGFATDGLVYGTLAAALIADEIANGGSEYAALYSPRRFTPIKSAKTFFVENANAAAYLVRDRLGKSRLDDFAAIQPGEGHVVELGGEKLALARDEDGHLHAVSAVCTHLKCIVHWNPAERSWDCPCHGSRFDIEGQVIEGPALSPLAPHPVVAEQVRGAAGAVG